MLQALEPANRFQPVIDRLVDKHGFRESDAVELYDDVVRYLICCAAHNGAVYSPTRRIDMAWHEFVLFTEDYAAFCAKWFGRFMHHRPFRRGEGGKARNTASCDNGGSCNCYGGGELHECGKDLITVAEELFATPDGNRTLSRNWDVSTPEHTLGERCRMFAAWVRKALRRPKAANCDDADECEGPACMG